MTLFVYVKGLEQITSLLFSLFEIAYPENVDLHNVIPLPEWCMWWFAPNRFVWRFGDCINYLIDWVFNKELFYVHEHEGEIEE